MPIHTPPSTKKQSNQHCRRRYFNHDHTAIVFHPLDGKLMSENKTKQRHFQKINYRC